MPSHHAAHHVAHVHRAARVAEAQRVQHAHDLGAHADDVAHDAADAGGRALDRQHLARVVVALVPEHQHGVLARRRQRRRRRRPRPGPITTCGRLRRQALEQVARGLVRAVLAPQDAEQHGLGPARRAPEQPRRAASPRRASSATPRVAQPRRDRGGVARLPRASRPGRRRRGRRSRAGLLGAREDRVHAAQVVVELEARRQRPRRRAARATAGPPRAPRGTACPPSAAASACPCTMRYASSRGQPGAASAPAARAARTPARRPPRGSRACARGARAGPRARRPGRRP